MARSEDCSTSSCSQVFLQYEPSLAGNVALLALFALLIPIAFTLGIRYQSSVFSTTIITGLFLEIIGYVGRILLTRNDDGYKVDFILSHLGTILAPTAISLAIFRLMPPIVAVYGETFQAWRPGWHNLVFYAFTTACVVLQAVGGLLSTVPADDTLTDIGVRILVAGLALHVSSMLVFAILGVRFACAVRFRKRSLDPSSLVVYNTRRFKAFIAGLSLAILLLVIRTVYRMIAIGEGFSSDLAGSETLFLVLDGVLVLLATILLLASFPGRMLGTTGSEHPIRHHKMSTKQVRRPVPMQLQQAPYTPSYQRISVRSNATPSPKQSPHKVTAPPAPHMNMVDSEALW